MDMVTTNRPQRAMSSPTRAKRTKKPLNEKTGAELLIRWMWMHR